MIKEIKIENFKSIESLNLELGRFNVFIGANGSGKSNILEGIAFGAAATADKLENEFLGTRIRVTKPELMVSAFTYQSNNKTVQFEFENDNKEQIKFNISYIDKNWKFKLSEDTPNFNKIDFLNKVSFSDKETIQYKGQEIPLSELPELKAGFQEMLNQLLSKFFPFSKDTSLDNFLIYAPENNFLRNFNEDTYIRPLGVRGEGLFNHILEISKENNEYFAKINEHLQLLDWFDSFEIPNDLMFTERRIKIKDRYLEEGLQYFDQRSANEGFLYLLFYLTLFISDETPKFFAIDNIDNAMNPKMGSELIHILSELAEKYDKQVILTTHNPAILDGLDLGNKELDQRLFVISRNKKGHTQALRVPHRESDERLSYRFIRGSIGGLPKNF